MGKFDYDGVEEGITFHYLPKPIEPAKEVEPTLEEALKNIVIEWEN